MKRKTRYWLWALSLAILVVLGVWVAGDRLLTGTRMEIVGALVFVIFVIWIAESIFDSVRRRLRSEVRGR
jgi:uncharacterized membrane protein YoaT (DUF817 family)